MGLLNNKGCEGCRSPLPTCKTVYWDNNPACRHIRKANTCPLKKLIIVSCKTDNEIKHLPHSDQSQGSIHMRLYLNATLELFCCCFIVFFSFYFEKIWKGYVPLLVGRRKQIKYIMQVFFFFLPLSLSWHIWNIKQKQRLKSQSCDVLVAVRRWLLHADQGKKLLKTSNIFAVSRLSADCTQKKHSTCARHEHKMAARKNKPKLYCYIYIQERNIQYFHECSYERSPHPPLLKSLPTLNPLLMRKA